MKDLSSKELLDETTVESLVEVIERKQATPESPGSKGSPETHFQYWRKKFAGAPLLRLPYDRPRATAHKGNCERKSFQLEADISEGLRLLSGQEGVALFMTLLAAFKSLIYRYTGVRDILIATPPCLPETEKMIGRFAGPLALRSYINPQVTFRELLCQIKDNVSETYDQKGPPPIALIDELERESKAQGSRMFQAGFSFESLSKSQPQRDSFGLAKGNIGLPSDLELGLAIIDTGAQLNGALVYDPTLFDGETIDRMIGHLETLLAGIVANPEQRIALLPILTRKEQDQLLNGWSNAASCDYPEVFAQQLFEEQSKLTPDKVVAVYNNISLSSRELDEESKQIANLIRRLRRWSKTDR